MRQKQSLSDRFWSKVNKNGPIPSHLTHLGECWVWTASKDPDGYGYFAMRISKEQKTTLLRAHRASALLHGLVNYFEPEQFALHKCDNSSCIRPEHLFIGNQRSNINDKMLKGRQARMQGEDHNQVKLNERQIEAIKVIWETNMLTQEKIAEIFGVSRENISMIVNNKSWKHLNEK